MTSPQRAEDPLAQCVSYVLSFYDLSPDLGSLKKLMPRENAALAMDDLPLLADRLHLELADQEARLHQAADVQVPVLITKPDGAEPRVFLPATTGEQRLYDPETGVRGCDLTALPDTDVRITLLRPTRQSMEVDAEHMERKRPIDWFWRPLKEFWPSFTEVLLCSLFINLFVLLIPLFTLNVYDQVIPNFAQETLVVLTTGVLIALVFDFLLKTVRTYVLERVAAKVGHEYDTKLMERMLLVDGERLKLGVGERANLFRELQGIREFYASKLIPTAVDLPFFILFMAVIYVISPVLTIVPAVGALVILALNAAIQIPINRATANYFASMQRKSTLLLETLGGTATFKLFNAVGSRLFRWSSSAEQASESARYNHFLLGVVQNVSLAVVHMVHVLVVVVGVFQIQSGLLTIGGLIACTILSGRAMAPIVNVGAVVSRWQQSKDVLVAIDGLFKLPHEGERAANQSADGELRGQIDLRDVSYKYPGQTRLALDGVSLSIQPGERIGLIGPTGAGKSTLAGLLTGLMQGYTGDIEFDRFALQSIAPAKLRANVAFVPQMPFFVGGTIRDNVLLGSEDVDESQLEQAIRLSGLDTVIQQTGLGLDTPVGENGAALSGGQRQAVSLARALVRDPAILVFDEPSTGLDSALEARLKNELAAYLEGRTYIMITHRTTMLDLVDRLVLLEGGRIRADGPKADVLRALSGKPAAAPGSAEGPQPVPH